MDNHVTESLIASNVLATLALPFFFFRLWIRIRIQRVGWDDIWATAAFICGTMNVVSGWIYVVQLSDESSSISMWIYMFAFTCLVWSVRISIILSITRTVPAGERLHRYGLMIVAFFLLMCFAFLAEEAIYCIYAYHAFHPTPSHPYFLCSLPLLSKIAELAVGCVAGAIAIVFPLKMLRSVNLPSRVHRLLRLLFSSSLLVSIACSLRAASRLVPELSSWSVVISTFQIAICLIVCNLLVIVTYLYRVLGYQRHDLTRDPTKQDSAVAKDGLFTPSMPQQMALTTIEHLFSIEIGDSVSVASDAIVFKPVSVADSSC